MRMVMSIIITPSKQNNEIALLSLKAKNFFTAIAPQVGIPKLAFEAVEKKFGWKASEDVFLNAVVKGSSVQDDWGGHGFSI